MLAAQGPLGGGQEISRVGELALRAAQKGNINAITDAGSAVNLAFAAVNSAAYNVRINLADLKDIEIKDQILAEVEKLEKAPWLIMEKIKSTLIERGGLFS